MISVAALNQHVDRDAQFTCWQFPTKILCLLFLGWGYLLFGGAMFSHFELDNERDAEQLVSFCVFACLFTFLDARWQHACPVLICTAAAPLVLCSLLFHPLVFHTHTLSPSHTQPSLCLDLTHSHTHTHTLSLSFSVVLCSIWPRLRMPWSEQTCLRTKRRC